MTADPSHGTGRRDKVAPMALASAAAGADAMLIEVHHQPDKALSERAIALSGAICQIDGPAPYDRACGRT